MYVRSQKLQKVCQDGGRGKGKAGRGGRGEMKLAFSRGGEKEERKEEKSRK